MTTEHIFIRLLNQYEQLSNQHDIDGCVALFSPDGIIVMGGEAYQGEKSIREAHEYDRESRTQVRFSDFEIEENLVRCSFWNEHQLSRVIGTGGTIGTAEFIFQDSKIQKFNILPPDLAERQRIMEKAAPVFQWLRENYPDTVAKWKGFDSSAGKAIFELAELWQTHLADKQS
jgi:hypothetical protein